MAGDRTLETEPFIRNIETRFGSLFLPPQVAEAKGLRLSRDPAEAGERAVYLRMQFTESSE